MGAVGTVAPPGTPAEPDRDQLSQAFAAVRTRLPLVALLLGLTALAWWFTADRMASMDAGPGTNLGTLDWFLGVWTVMMAAMMLPSLVPTTALYARMTRGRRALQPLMFTGAYLAVWGAAGLVAYGLFVAGRSLLSQQLAWGSGGRWLAAALIAAAALYELTPAKDYCLAKCRTPVGFLRANWRDGRLGAVQMGARQAGWCLGCCWALMAALFALGVMSLTWMAFISSLIILEKTVRWRSVVTLGTAAVLLTLAVAIVIDPRAVPGLVVPSAAHGAMHMMETMP